MSKILVVGGAGYIGSYVNKLLTEQGFDTVVFDNLSTGSTDLVPYGELIKGDLGNRDDLEKLFSQHTFDAVFHFAASKNVGESCQHPDRYYRNNVVNTLHLLDALVKHEIPHCIFSSSAAIFGASDQPTCDESHPTNPLNPYGRTKLMMEQIMQDYHQSFGIHFAFLRYFNAAGADPQGILTPDLTQQTNLLPIIVSSALHNKPLKIFGTDYPTKDGTCIRDYIHLHDLATAHIQSLHYLKKHGGAHPFNLGNGQGFSVLEMIQAFEKTTGQTLKIEPADRRPGDPPKLIADATKAHTQLAWNPIYPNLEDMTLHSWIAMTQPHTPCRG